VKDFRSCGELYWKLYQSAFDADPVSLANIQMYPSVKLIE
jgi:integrator complex subunit 7